MHRTNKIGIFILLIKLPENGATFNSLKKTIYPNSIRNLQITNKLCQSELLNCNLGLYCGVKNTGNEIGVFGERKLLFWLNFFARSCM